MEEAKREQASDSVRANKRIKNESELVSNKTKC